MFEELHLGDQQSPEPLILRVNTYKVHMKTQHKDRKICGTEDHQVLMWNWRPFLGAAAT